MAQVDALRFLAHVAKLFAPNIQDGQVFISYIGEDNSYTIQADNIIRDSDTKVEVEDNLTSTSPNSALSANQGRVLKGLIDGKTSVTIANNLTTTTPGQALDASQGKILADALAEIDTTGGCGSSVQNDLTTARVTTALLETDYLYLERNGTIYKIQASNINYLMCEGWVYEPACSDLY